MRRAWIGAAVAGVVLAAVAIVLITSREEPAAQPEAGVRTVFVGDSITRGVSPETQGFSDEHSWVTYAVVDERSPWDYQANAALFGLTLLQMETSLRGNVIDEGAEGVVIMGGTNDVLQDIPTADSIAALRAMVEVARAEGIEVWIVAPTPLDPGYGRSVAELVEAEQALADELGVPFVDPTAAVTGADGAWRPELTVDGVHPSEEGAGVIADAVLQEFGR